MKIRIQATVELLRPSRPTAVADELHRPRLHTRRDRRRTVRRWLKALATEQILRRNAGVALAPVPLRVGLVTSVGSAAHADMLKVFSGSGFAFQNHRDRHGRSGRRCARRDRSRHRRGGRPGVDVVVLARGGGSRTDLVAFDHEIVARAIAMCSRPVFTGIGHETDRSVADETAHTACSTPTAAARAVVQRVEDWLEQLDDHRSQDRGVQPPRPGRGRAAGPASRRRARPSNATGRGAAGRPQPRRSRPPGRCTRDGRPQLAGRRVAAVTYRLGQAGPAAERRAGSRLDRASARLSVAGRHEIRHAQRHLDAVATRVRALDPALILGRGWSLTRRDDGTLLRSVQDVSPGDSIVTHLSDGTLDSTIHARKRPSEDLNQ